MKLEVTKGFDNKFQVSHAVKMGGHYELGPQKQRAKERSRLQGGSKDQFLYEFTTTYVNTNYNVNQKKKKVFHYYYLIK